MTVIPRYRKIFAAIPLMDELDYLPALLSKLAAQDLSGFKVFFCVNQPENWWDQPLRREVCERNLASMAYIREHAAFPVHVIDRASRGRGWRGKQLGVGWARKVAMDEVLGEAIDEDIILTLDGDTAFNANYFSTVWENFNARPQAVGLSVPYYHRLTGREAEDRAILRYEIYMRAYVINLWRINNPYHFTALGSAMAIPVWAYKAIGGMSPKKSGEDFYFLQKLIKYGELLTWNKEKVYPAARFSDRVFFGTGPAMIKGAAGDWNSYPVYHHSLFDEVGETYRSFGRLFNEKVETPMDAFFNEVLKMPDLWEPLRKNSTNPAQFSRACRDRVDGLRILQYLKHTQGGRGFGDEDCLADLLKIHYPQKCMNLDFLSEGFTFDALSIGSLNDIRDILTGIEEEYQMAHHHA